MQPVNRWPPSNWRIWAAGAAGFVLLAGVLLSSKPATRPRVDRAPQPTELTSEQYAAAQSHPLDCYTLKAGEAGTLMPPYEYLEVLRIVDANSCLVAPRRRPAAARPPLLITNFPTADAATGEQYTVLGCVFLVTGTRDFGPLRVHVLQKLPNRD